MCKSDVGNVKPFLRVSIAGIHDFQERFPFSQLTLLVYGFGMASSVIDGWYRFLAPES
jgi:hypothetical protein